MGNMLISIVREGSRAFIHTLDYLTLVCSHPIFGVDMALALARDTVSLRRSRYFKDVVVRSDMQRISFATIQVNCKYCKMTNCVKPKMYA